MRNAIEGLKRPRMQISPLNNFLDTEQIILVVLVGKIVHKISLTHIIEFSQNVSEICQNSMKVLLRLGKTPNISV